MKTPLLTFITFLFATSLLFAQPKRNQVFAAAGYLGANLSQIDGDYYFGYNQPGLRFGIETQYLISPKSFVTVGLGYSQTGARSTRSERGDAGGKGIQLRISSIEVPLLFNYRLGPKNATGKKDDFKLFRSTTIQVGLSVLRLANYRINRTGRTNNLPRTENFVAVEDQFEQFDMHLLFGLTIPVGLRTSIMMQHGKSILGFYRPDVSTIGDGNVLPLFPYYLSFGVKYTVY